MKYFFILGSNPAVSAAEILAVLRDVTHTISAASRQVLIVETDKGLNVSELLAKLGGSIKVGRLTGQVVPIDPIVVAKYMADTLAGRDTAGKTKFGFSVYALDGARTEDVAARIARQIQNAGMETKRFLKEAGLSVRWVRPQVGSVLTSVVVQKEGLLDSGAEFVLLAKDGQLEVGITESVQPFELFSDIDYGRPDRDAYSGMLPPKLARMMLNLAGVQPNSVVWDPFCGSGTVATEALRMGVKAVFASDLRAEAVASTERNAEWLTEKGYVTSERARVCAFVNDARHRADIIAAKSIDAVVSEPYLGPPRRGQESRKELVQRLDELTELYRDALAAWIPVLKDGASVVLALPLYLLGEERLGISLGDITAGKYIAENLISSESAVQNLGVADNTGRGLFYGRGGQLVWREIVRLRPI